MGEVKERLIEVLIKNKLMNSPNEEEAFVEGFKSLEINSMTFIKAVVSVEEEFDIIFGEEELNYELFESFDSLVALIQRKMEE